MRAFRALPVAGADEDFAVALALFAMKLVNRHEGKIFEFAEISSKETERNISAPEARKKIANGFSRGFGRAKR